MEKLEQWKKGHPKEYNQLVHVHQMHHKSPYAVKGSDMLRDVWAYVKTLKDTIASQVAGCTPRNASNPRHADTPCCYHCYYHTQASQLATLNESLMATMEANIELAEENEALRNRGPERIEIEDDAMKAIFTLIHAVLTLIHAVLTLIHAVLTLIHAVLTLV